MGRVGGTLGLHLSQVNGSQLSPTVPFPPQMGTSPVKIARYQTPLLWTMVGGISCQMLMDRVGVKVRVP